MKIIIITILKSIYTAMIAIYISTCLKTDLYVCLYIYLFPQPLFLSKSKNVLCIHVPCSLHFLLSVNNFVYHRNQGPTYKFFIDGMIQEKLNVTILVAFISKILRVCLGHIFKIFSDSYKC